MLPDTTPPRRQWPWKAFSAADWRELGDDYLLPFDYRTISFGGLCARTPSLWSTPRQMLNRFIPPKYPEGLEWEADGAYWWKNPRFPKSREHRAFACYFIAAMLEVDDA